MRYMYGLFTLALALGLATAASAVPTLLGPTGFLVTPTAETLQANDFNFMLYGIEHSNSTGYTLNYGVRPNLEVGFTRLPAQQTIINAKYAFQPEGESKVGLAFGAIDATDQVNASIYAVASTKFYPGDLYGVDNFHANLGIAAGSDSRSPITLHGLFGGLSFDLAKLVTLMVEDDGSTINYGARGILFRNFFTEIGIAGREHNFTGTAGYQSQF